MAKVKYKRSLCWLRRDLRLSDNKALQQACSESEEVFVAFVFDSVILDRLEARDDMRVNFIHATLKNLDQALQQYGSALLWLAGNPCEEIPRAVRLYDIEAVFTNEDYEAYGKERDQIIGKLLQQRKVDFHRFKDQVIFAGSEISKKDGQPYKVFTPYKKAWLQSLHASHIEDFKAALKNLAPLKKKQLTLKKIGFRSCALDVALSERAVKAQLKIFLKKVSHYEKDRNFPHLKGTSHLSLHLRFGTISIRECVRAVWQDPSRGAQTWLSELIWRDFYQMVLDQYPHVNKQAFLLKYDQIKWPGSRQHFKAWCEGRTGYPLVDAAMRQLNQTGWMHNRLRMVTASFLIKDLLISWKEGEKYFAEKLLDFDFAANNGGWQWCASTGCDAQPYFRIFNPISQSLKFDPDGEFIRQYVPELRELSHKDIHFPAWAQEKNLPPGFQLGKSYPHPLVDHAAQRMKAVLLYKRF